MAQHSWGCPRAETVPVLSSCCPSTQHSVRHIMDELQVIFSQGVCVCVRVRTHVSWVNAGWALLAACGVLGLGANSLVLWLTP